MKQKRLSGRQTLGSNLVNFVFFIIIKFFSAFFFLSFLVHYKIDVNIQAKPLAFNTNAKAK